MSKELGLRINASKIKVMAIDWAECLPQFDVLKEDEKIDTFVYLNLAVEVFGGSLVEMWCQIALGKSVMT